MILVFIYRIDHPFRGSPLYSYSKKTLRIMYSMFIVLLVLVLWLMIVVIALNEYKALVYIPGALFGILLITLSTILFVMFTRKLKQMHRTFTRITYSSTDSVNTAATATNTATADTGVTAAAADDDNLGQLTKLIRKFTVLYALNLSSTVIFIFLSLICDWVFEDSGADIEYFISRLMFIPDSIIGIITMYFTLKQHNEEYYKCCSCCDNCCNNSCNKCNSDLMVERKGKHPTDITMTLQTETPTSGPSSKSY